MRPPSVTGGFLPGAAEVGFFRSYPDQEARSRLSYDRTGDLFAQIACKPDAAQ